MNPLESDTWHVACSRLRLTLEFLPWDWDKLGDQRRGGRLGREQVLDLKKEICGSSLDNIGSLLFAVIQRELS